MEILIKYKKNQHPNLLKINNQIIMEQIIPILIKKVIIIIKYHQITITIIIIQIETEIHLNYPYIQTIKIATTTIIQIVLIKPIERIHKIKDKMI